jgi:hypothetical protein
MASSFVLVDLGGRVLRRPLAAQHQDGLERLDGGLAVGHADVGHALEELGLDVELALGRDLLEQQDGLAEVAVVAAAVVVAAEQEEQLVAHVLERVVLERGLVVQADLLEDARGLRQHVRQRGEPLERGLEEGVRVAGLDDLLEEVEGASVELQLVHGLAHEELGALHVARIVLAVAGHDLEQLDRRRGEVLAVVELDGAVEQRRLRRRAVGLELHVGRRGASLGLVLGEHGRRTTNEQAESNGRAGERGGESATERAEGGSTTNHLDGLRRASDRAR